MSTSLTPQQRFIRKTRTAANGCIEWTGEIGNNGYGRFWFEGKNVLAHRWSYEHHVGPIPEGLVIDHLCRNKRCVNAAHLEPVTTSENVLRGVGPQIAVARFAAITECPAGHPYTEENTYRGGRGRTCRTCKRELARQWYQANRQLTIDRSAAWQKANADRVRDSHRHSARRSRAKAAS